MYLKLQTGDYLLLVGGTTDKLKLASPPAELIESVALSESIVAEYVLATSGIEESFSVGDEWKNNLSGSGDSFSMGDSITASQVKTPGAPISEGFVLNDGWDAYQGRLTTKPISNILMIDDGSTSMRVKRSPLEKVINKIVLQYDRDWSGDGEEPYRKTISGSDSGSIAKYGEKENPDLFRFDFVRSEAMATNLLNFYLARLKERRKLVNLVCFLDLIELEFGDPVNIPSLNYLVCEVQKVNVRPGSGVRDRIDQIELELLEYGAMFGI